MKIILTQDVSGLGRKYDVKDVSDGYARNFLIARGLAELATEKRIKAAEAKKKQTEQLKEIDKDILEKNLTELEGIKVSVEEKANEKGHLFAGIHKEEISKILKEQKRLDIPADLIELEHPIKETGEHKIKASGKEFILEINAKKQ
ncbi:MAG: 50S ribosomal protein L9 [bacterium]|nr:50S ribosomal protein L9 [bacterium]